MRICFAVLYFSDALANLSPRQYLDHFPLMRHLPASLAELGHEVHVVQLYPRAEFRETVDVRTHFVRPSRLELLASVPGARVSSRGGAGQKLAFSAADFIRGLEPDVVHYHGLLSTLNLFWLLRRLGRKGPPIVGHYHGGQPSSNPLVRRIQRKNLRHLAAALFTTSELAEPFVTYGMLRREQVNQVVEVSTALRRQPRDMARQTAGMFGSPVFLCAGRLHPLKDPLVALRGFAIIAEQWPEAQLYLYYLSSELLSELKRFVTGKPWLIGRVHFRGRVPHEQMEAVFSSADFLLQASKHEVASYAVLEALACGTIPVVTDIPALRAITNNGQHGILFPVGDHEELARRVLAFDLNRTAERAEEGRRYFEQALSYKAMAQRLAEVYRGAIGR